MAAVQSTVCEQFISASGALRVPFLFGGLRLSSDFQGNRNGSRLRALDVFHFPRHAWLRTWRGPGWCGLSSRHPSRARHLLASYSGRILLPRTSRSKAPALDRGSSISSSVHRGQVG